jgi:multicomponent Na+:H+ antiporter subunit F
MHMIVLYIALAWTALLLGICGWITIRASSLTMRILGLKTFTLILVALLVLFAYLTKAAYYLDAAFFLILLSFTGTLAAARYHSARGIFS